MPRDLAIPSGSEPRQAPHVGSYCGPRFGNKPRNTPQAAVTAAALADAPAAGEVAAV
jgi:hypothetical protein